MTEDQHRHDDEDAHAAGAPGSAMAELLDLDAEVLHAYLSDVTAWLGELAGDPSPRVVMDLGSGTGTGTFALLRRYPRADAVALDVSADLLRHLRDRARDLGVSERIRTVQADLDATWPAVGTVDLVWASASLHHLRDPDRALAGVHDALRPGGLLAVLEMDGFPRFLPDDLGVGRPGLEARCHAALAQAHAREVPHLGSDWGPRLSRAGFALEAERPFRIELTPPLPPSAGRYALASLRRLRAALDGQLSADDLTALDVLLDGHGPNSVLHRDDLTVRATRTVWIARRPRSDA